MHEGVSMYALARWLQMESLPTSNSHYNMYSESLYMFVLYTVFLDITCKLNSYTHVHVHSCKYVYCMSLLFGLSLKVKESFGFLSRWGLGGDKRQGGGREGEREGGRANGK